MKTSEADGKKVYNMTLAESVFFLNKGSIQSALQEVEAGSKLVIDASDTLHIDQDVIDLFNDFETNAGYKEIEVERIDFKKEAKDADDPARLTRINGATS